MHRCADTVLDTVPIASDFDVNINIHAVWTAEKTRERRERDARCPAHLLTPPSPAPPPQDGKLKSLETKNSELSRELLTAQEEARRLVKRVDALLQSKATQSTKAGAYQRQIALLEKKLASAELRASLAAAT